MAILAYSTIHEKARLKKQMLFPEEYAILTLVSAISVEIAAVIADIPNCFL